MSHRTQDEARDASNRVATRAAVFLSILILLAAFLTAACVGSGGGSSQQGTTVIGQPDNTNKEPPR